ncbi:MAG TPA: acetyl-CoA carboxylase biotin carboxyl carrier protein subunit [Candidatus Kapabacteria bacterium]|nr:acetyl-CoA carboxylase biotin carboxyl carrier protein subunit [Candidatus Kapabacteria bacterium]
MINEKRFSSISDPEIISSDEGAFLLRVGGGLVEVYRTGQESYSDGNSLHDISVTIESDRERLVNERFATFGLGKEGAAVKKTNIVKAPMPGMVKSVLVEAGLHVTRGTAIIILEAMKMENSITATIDGVIIKLSVSQGMSLEKNAIICEIEPRT